MPLDASSLVVTTTYDAGSGFQPWLPGGIPASAGSPTAVTVRVDVAYPWHAATWLVGSLFSASGARTFGSSSQMDTIR